MYKCFFQSRRKTRFTYLFVLVYMVRRVGGVFESMRCALDSGPAVPAGGTGGVVADGHFGWLGIIQHAFYIAKSTQYAITTGVLIHPGFVLASAEDIGKINAEEFANTTKFILWGTDGSKHVLKVYDYIVHPEYTNKVTSATVALVRLHMWATGRRNAAPVMPVCLPLRGMGDIQSIYVVKFTDANMKMEKEILKVNYVPNRECEEFYYKAGLSLKDKAPMHSLCVVQAGRHAPCLWEAGSVLITRLNYAHWTLLGFGVRGPGCGAPARYVTVHRYLPWLDDTIAMGPDALAQRRMGGPGRVRKLIARQFSPYNLTLFDPETLLPTEYGQCNRRSRGNVQFKDDMTLVTSANFGLGFYFLEVSSIIQFTCLTVFMRVAARTRAGVWVEHNCPGASVGLAPDVTAGPTLEYESCFYYYKTTAYVELRFRFSGKADVVLVLYGFPQRRMNVNPWPQHPTSTENWRPTTAPAKIMYHNFLPWMWNILY